MTKLFGLSIAVLSGIVLGVFVVPIILSICTTVIVAQWCQPDSIDYKSNDPYCLSIVRKVDLKPSFSDVHKYSIYVGHGPEKKPSYGHFMDYSVAYTSDDEGCSTDRACLAQKSVVRWTTEGIELISLSGHRLFIPCGQFVGGR